jgi:hypothetical protein
MAEAVQTAVEELLIPFQVASSPPEGADKSKPRPLPKTILPKLSTEEFFQKFLVYADRFTDHCCQELSKILRQASVLPEVRGTPTLELAKQIRQGGFEALDKILVSYIEALKRIHVDLQGIAVSLSNSSLIGEAMKGAAIGQVAGGFGGGGKLLGTVGALAAAGQEAMKQQALLEMQNRLYAEAKDLAFSKIGEYLQAVESLPEHLLDFGCAKCFGAQVDFTLQGAVLKGVESHVGERLRASIAMAANLADAEARKPKQGPIAQRRARSVRLPQPDEGWMCGEYKGQRFFSNKQIVVKGEPPAGSRLSDQGLSGQLERIFDGVYFRPVSAEAFSLGPNGNEVIWFTDGTCVSALYHDYFAVNHPDARFFSSGRKSQVKVADSRGEVLGAVMPLAPTEPPLAVKALLEAAQRAGAQLPPEPNAALGRMLLILGLVVWPLWLIPALSGRFPKRQRKIAIWLIVGFATLALVAGLLLGGNR